VFMFGEKQAIACVIVILLNKIRVDYSYSRAVSAEMFNLL
jgi:hypothetical protein